MPYELIIAEKPNAAKKIAEALSDGKAVKEGDKGIPLYHVTHKGKDIKVACAVGHLYSVAEKEKSFKYPSYDIQWVPTSEVDKESTHTKRYADAIKRAAKDATELTVACDYDVEGEVIGLNIVRELCKRKDANRMKFSTLTVEDLREAYEHKQKHLDWGQAKAGETRHFLDWMYGINLSRALMLAVQAAGSFKVLSSGRVQGPALKIIVDKEREIKAFVPEPYWQLELQTVKGNEEFIANHKKDKFDKEADAKAIHAKCKGKEAVVAALDEKASNQSPPTPFDLGTLQTEAYRAFGIDPKYTMQIAQNLYLAGATSYPRTSSQKLPKEIGYQKILTLLAKQESYNVLANGLLKKEKLIPNEGPKTDPAHPAIYPTGLSPNKMSERDHKVYDLIVKRFFAVFGDPAKRLTVTATLEVNKEPFIAKGTTTVVPGWHLLYAPYVSLKDELLPPMKVGEHLEVKKLSLLAKETQPPRRFTPSSIISDLEKRSLGTKSTRADIVDSLFKRGYVTGKSIGATELGIRTIATLEKYCPEIIDEELTRSFEEEMDGIREDKTTPEQVLAHARKELDKTLTKFKKSEMAIGKELIEAQRETRDAQATIGSCPKCKEGTLKVTFSRKTKKRFVGCARYPDCDFTSPLPQGGMIAATDKVCPHDQYPIISIHSKGRRPQDICLNMNCPGKAVSASVEKTAESQEAHHSRICPKCGKPMVLRRSIYGEFWGCSGYPNCRQTQRLDSPVKPVAPTAGTTAPASHATHAPAVTHAIEAKENPVTTVKATAIAAAKTSKAKKTPTVKAPTDEVKPKAAAKKAKK